MYDVHPTPRNSQGSGLLHRQTAARQCGEAWLRQEPGMENFCPKSRNKAKSPDTENRWFLSPGFEHEALGALTAAGASQFWVQLRGYQSGSCSCLSDVIRCDPMPPLICCATTFTSSALCLCFPVPPAPCPSPPCDGGCASARLKLDYISDLQFGLFPGECTFCTPCVLLLSHGIFNLPAWNPAAASHAWMPAASKAILTKLAAQCCAATDYEHLRGHFCLLWSFKCLSCK